MVWQAGTGFGEMHHVRRCLAQLALDPTDDIYFVVAFLDDRAFAQQYPGHRIRPHMLGVALVSYCSAGDGGALAVLCHTPPFWGRVTGFSVTGHRPRELLQRWQWGYSVWLFPVIYLPWVQCVRHYRSAGPAVHVHEAAHKLA